MQLVLRDNYDPQVKDYCNVIVRDEIQNRIWIFDSNGVYVELDNPNSDLNFVLKNSQYPQLLSTSLVLGDGFVIYGQDTNTSPWQSRSLLKFLSQGDPEHHFPYADVGDEAARLNLSSLGRVSVNNTSLLAYLSDIPTLPDMTRYLQTNSIQGGTNISVDNTNPAAPIINNTLDITHLLAQGSLRAGNNISIDNTNPANPLISAEVDSFHFEGPFDATTDITNPQNNIIYLVGTSEPYEMYFWDGTDFKQMGSANMPDLSGYVQSVNAGTNISVDNSDPQKPVVSTSGLLTTNSIQAGSNIAIDNSDPTKPKISAIIPESPEIPVSVLRIIPGDNIMVDDTDVTHPIVSATIPSGGGGGTETHYITDYNVAEINRANPNSISVAFLFVPNNAASTLPNLPDGYRIVENNNVQTPLFADLSFNRRSVYTTAQNITVLTADSSGYNQDGGVGAHGVSVLSTTNNVAGQARSELFIYNAPMSGVYRWVINGGLVGGLDRTNAYVMVRRVPARGIVTNNPYSNTVLWGTLPSVSGTPWASITTGMLLGGVFHDNEQGSYPIPTTDNVLASQANNLNPVTTQCGNVYLMRGDKILFGYSYAGSSVVGNPAFSIQLVEWKGDLL